MHPWLSHYFWNINVSREYFLLLNYLLILLLAFSNFFSFFGGFFLLLLFKVFKDIKRQTLVALEALVNHKSVFYVRVTETNDMLRVGVFMVVIGAIFFDWFGRLDQLSDVDCSRVGCLLQLLD
jgi:hypothetical protein